MFTFKSHLASSVHRGKPTSTEHAVLLQKGIVATLCSQEVAREASVSQNKETWKPAWKNLVLAHKNSRGNGEKKQFHNSCTDLMLPVKYNELLSALTNKSHDYNNSTAFTLK